MDRQAIFNTVVAKAREQGCRSYDEEKKLCLYEDRDGHHCFVGFLLPPGHPGIAYHGDVRDLVEEYPDLNELWKIDVDKVDEESGNPEDLHFLLNLQSIHDDNEIAAWEVEFEKFARDWNLMYALTILRN
jgi:hypothetical protein